MNSGNYSKIHKKKVSEFMKPKEPLDQAIPPTSLGILRDFMVRIGSDLHGLP